MDTRVESNICFLQGWRFGVTKESEKQKHAIQRYTRDRQSVVWHVLMLCNNITSIRD